MCNVWYFAKLRIRFGRFISFGRKWLVVFWRRLQLKVLQFSKFGLWSKETPHTLQIEQQAPETILKYYPLFPLFINWFIFLCFGFLWLWEWLLSQSIFIFLDSLFHSEPSDLDTESRSRTNKTIKTSESKLVTTFPSRGKRALIQARCALGSSGRRPQ